MLWKSIVLTIIICGLFILGASSVITVPVDTGDAVGPIGIIAESSK